MRGGGVEMENCGGYLAGWVYGLVKGPRAALSALGGVSDGPIA